jgi:uncharacterized phiE125 gp8 family phage protein
MNDNKLITPVTTELLSRESLVKPYLKISHTDEDSLLDVLITASRQMIEKWCGIAIGEQERQWIIDASCETEIPYGPVTSVDAVEYKTADGYEAKTLDDDYEVEDGARFPTFKPLTEGRWKVDYTTGYTSDTIESELKTIWLKLIAHLYVNRGDSGGTIPTDIKYALNPYKRNLI